MRAALLPERLNEVVRSHWLIENGQHWVLDVVMNEDQMRNRRDHGPENLAMLRHLALNLAELEPSNGSMRGKLKRAGWNDDYLTTILAGFGAVEMRALLVGPGRPPRRWADITFCCDRAAPR